MERADKGLTKACAWLFVPRAFAVVTLAAASWLIPVDASAQSTRNFQMTLIGSSDAYASPPPAHPSYNVPVDVPTFYHDRQSVPSSGPIIVEVSLQNDLSALNVDWSRVIAVLVDEPYTAALDAEFHDINTQPCNAGSARALNVQGTTNNLVGKATWLRANAPHARFWVNFTWREPYWEQTYQCTFNNEKFDVVSLDIYDRNFEPEIRGYYDYFTTHRAAPSQQVALIPSVYSTNAQPEWVATTRLPEFTAYAQSKNQTCNLPLGPSGSTGYYDGCPVWIVAGWLGGALPYVEGGTTFYPIEHANSAPIRWTWESIVARPREPVPPAMWRWLPPVVGLLLN